MHLEGCIVSKVGHVLLSYTADQYLWKIDNELFAGINFSGLDGHLWLIGQASVTTMLRWSISIVPFMVFLGHACAVKALATFAAQTQTLF